PVAAGQQVGRERQRRVLLRHGHELALAPALGSEELDAPGTSPGQPLEDQIRLGNLGGEEDLGRRGHLAGVELAEKGGEQLALAFPAQPLEEEGLAPEEPAAT